MRAVRPLGVILLFLTFAQCATGDRMLVRREERARRMPGAAGDEVISPAVFEQQSNRGQDNGSPRHPREERMQRAGSFDGDLRSLPDRPGRKRERPEREGPEPAPVELRDQANPPQNDPIPSGVDAQELSAPAPGPSADFAGLDFQNWGNGHPPDTNGDVGPTYYIQTINTSIGVYDKTTGTRVSAFTFDTFMSQGSFGNVCDTDNFGDPVVLYDTFEDRWVIADFAFILDGSNNVVNPPGAFQCFAVSKTGDPVSGGWNFYSINTTGGLGDYPKLGVWPDGIYMSVNMFDYAAAGSFQNVRLYALNKAQMYAGAPSVQSVSFDLPASEFTVLPANARLQTGTPPLGAPNYFASVWNYLNVVSVWQLQVNWNSLSLTTLSGPVHSLTSSNWSQLNTTPAGTVPSPANRLDTLYPRLMMQNQYSNIAGVESLWNSHTVGASGTTSTQSAVRYYEVRVTGGTVNANATQAFTYSPDAINRFMPSVAVDRANNLAIGYSTSSASTNPAIKYAGRLASDAVNSITQTETSLINGTGSQSGNCGPSSCTRWGDYSAMSLDPNGCTFWYTNEYYQTTGLNHQTRIGAFAFSACTPAGLGNLQGTVKTTAGVPIGGATVMLGSRSATTDSSGNYSFINLAAGTYPGATASYPGYSPASFTSIVVPGSGTATRDFVLSTAAASGCFTDTTQADFQAGVAANCDLSGPGNVTLLNPAVVDQQNVTVGNVGFLFNNTTWRGQTFVPSVSGTVTRVDLDLFCSGCSGTPQNLTVSIRATNGTVPIGADLAVATIAGFTSGAGGFFSANFASPATVTAGTRYAVLVRANGTFSGQYAALCSCTPNSNPYANGRFVSSTNSGATWSSDNTSGGRDLGFKIYMPSGFTSSGTFVSSTKDANPAAGLTAAWGNLSWNATTPAGTTLKLQVAASNDANGPFNFVGPDGSAATFFTTTGASLSQFNGRRYLQYKVFMTTANSAVTPTLDDVTLCFDTAVSEESVAAAVVSGATRLQQLQNADGGWYFLAADTSCGLGAGVSCPNIIGTTALGLLTAYDRTHDAGVLADAVAAGNLLQSMHSADPARRPFTQDLEFLVSLSSATGDSQYSSLATTWFGNVTALYPNPADRVDAAIASRNSQGIKSLAAWDVASIIRMAKAAGNVSYAGGLAASIIARESDWTNQSYTLLGMGSLLWAIHDLPGFDSTIDSYRSWLLSHQDADGTWSGGNLQIASYVALGLGAVGGSGTAPAIESAVAFFIAHQLANLGWPFSFVNGVAGGEYPMVDSEVMRAMHVLYNTQAGQSVQLSPAQLATVTFSNVMAPGATTVVAQQSTGGVPPDFRVIEGLTYDVQTTASVNGPTTVCFSSALTAGLANVRILHKEGDRFVDRTSSANCASVDSLDAFAIAEKTDVEAPVLSVSLSPAEISPANNKMITITATISVTDNADPSPAITLVSITASGDGTGNNKEDVEGAAIGTDDREFAVRAEASRTGRLYTIVYRATDRSGNATEVAKTVTVK